MNEKNEKILALFSILLIVYTPYFIILSGLDYNCIFGGTCEPQSTPYGIFTEHQMELTLFLILLGLFILFHLWIIFSWWKKYPLEE